jgi:hypothetical protein
MTLHIHGNVQNRECAQHAHAVDGPTGREKTRVQVGLPSQAGAESHIIQAIFAPAMLGAANAQAVGLLLANRLMDYEER